MSKTQSKLSDDSDLNKVLSEVSKATNTRIGYLNSLQSNQEDRIPSGSLSLDLALGGGWLRGRVHELYGPEMSGKTMLTLFAISDAQKLGHGTAFVDMEHALNPEWAESLGVDLNKLVFTQPDSGEQALGVVEELSKSGKFGLVVIDSVAGLVPQAELEGDIGDQHVGRQARLVGQALRMIVPSAYKTKTGLLFINQLRHKIGVMFGNPETTPGGMALKFWSSIRVSVRKDMKDKRVGDTGDLTGHDVRVKVEKNKTFPPFRDAVVPIDYHTGLRSFEDTEKAAEKTGLVTLSGPSVSYHGKIGALTQGQPFRGTKAFVSFLESNLEVFKQFRKEVEASVKNAVSSKKSDVRDGK